MAFAAALGALILTGCDSKDDRIAGTEVENEIGLLYEPDGGPSAGAAVRIVPVAFNPQPGAAKTAAGVYKLETDARGRYSVAGIPAGQYNILASKDALVAYQDSITLDGGATPLKPDTLAAAGSITGVVALQPNHNPATATVQLLGTTHYANVDAGGRFGLDNLAAGVYSVRVATTESGYTPLYTRFEIGEGTRTILADTLKPVFTGIPVVKGLSIAYDTARGVVHLAWNRSDYPNLIGYVVYRDTLLTRTLSTQPLSPSRILDTSYADTLTWTLRDPNEPPQRWEYRVAVLASNGKYGETFASVSITALSPATLKTFVNLETAGTMGDMVTVDGRFRLIAHYRNAGLGNVRITWKADSLAIPVRVKTLSAKAGTDTLDAVAPGLAGEFAYEVRVTDAAGEVWSADTTLLAVTWSRKADRPWPAYAHAGKFPVDMPMLSLGGKAYVFGSRGDESHPALSSYDPGTDAWTLKAEAPALGSPAVLDGKIYLATDSSLYAYDPAVDSWSRKAPLLVHRQSLSPIPTATAGGRLIVYDGLITTRASGGFLSSSMEAYDPAQDRWTALAPPYTISQAGLLTANGRLFKTGFRTLSEYDFGAGKWSVISTGMPAEELTPMAPFENSLNFLFNQRQVATFLLDQDVADYRAPLPLMPAYTDFSFQVLEGKLYGFFQAGEDRILVAMYRRAENKWSMMPPLATRGNRFACAVAAGNVVIVTYYDLKSPKRETLPATYLYPPMP